MRLNQPSTKVNQTEGNYDCNEKNSSQVNRYKLSHSWGKSDQVNSDFGFLSSEWLKEFGQFS